MIDYKWIKDEAGPRMVMEGYALLGLKETPGPGNTSAIMQMAADFGIADKYSGDALAWCGLAHAYVIKKSGYTLPLSGWDILRALRFEAFGIPIEKDKAMFGDTLIFKRPEGGHVGTYIGEDDTCFHVMGGNQSDMYCITRILKSRLYAVRRPAYHNQPIQVRKIYLDPHGKPSENEA